jgi:hypothetical protein
MQCTYRLADEYSKTKVFDLLNRLGNHTLMLEDAKETSFLDMSMETTSSKRRRVTPHQPCECSEYLDALADKCLARRLELVGKNVEAMTAGETGAEPLRIALRGMYATLGEHERLSTPRVRAMYERVYVGGGSLMGLTASEVNSLKTGTRLLAHCVDYMWAQLLATTAFTVNANDQLVDYRNQGYRNVGMYINQAQLQQEMTNYFNTMRVYGYAVEYMSRNARLLNIGADKVYRTLVALDRNMEMSEVGTSVLADNLIKASETLQDAISGFVAFSQSEIEKYGEKLPELLQRKFLQPYADFSAGAIDGYLQSSQKKSDLLTLSTQRNADNQQYAMETVGMNSFKQSFRSAMEESDSREQRFIDHSRGRVHDFVDTVVTNMITNQTNTIKAFVGQNQAKLSNLAASTDTSATKLLDITDRITQKTGTSRNNAFEGSNAARAVFSDQLNSLANISQIELQQLQSDAIQAPDQVTVQYTSNIGSMMNQIDQTNSNFALQGFAYGVATKQATSGINTAYAQFDNRFGTNSQSVHDAVRNSASGVFGTVMNSAAGIESMGASSGHTSAAMKAAAYEMFQRSGLMLSTQNNRLGSTTTVSAATVERAVQNLTSLLSNTSMSAEEKSLMFTQAIQALHGANNVVRSQGELIDQTVRQTTSGSSSLLAQNNENLNTLLSRYSSVFAPAIDSYIGKSIGKNQLGLNAVLQSKLAEVLLGHSSFDKSGTTEYLARLFGTANTQSSSMSRASGQAATLVDMFNSVMGSSVSHDPQLLETKSQIASKLANLIQSWLNRVEAAKAKAQSSLGQSTIDQLSKVNTYAGATGNIADTLMYQLQRELSSFQSTESSFTGPKKTKFETLDFSVPQVKFVDFDTAIRNVSSGLIAANQTAALQIEKITTDDIAAVRNIPVAASARISAILEILFGTNGLIGTDLDDVADNVGGVAAGRVSGYVSSKKSATDILSQVASSLGINNMKLMDLLAHSQRRFDVVPSVNNIQDVLGNKSAADTQVGKIVSSAFDGSIALTRELNASLNAGLSDLGNLSKLNATLTAYKTELANSENKRAVFLSNNLMNEITDVVADFANDLIYQALAVQSSPELIYDRLIKSRASIDLRLKQIVTNYLLSSRNSKGQLGVSKQAVSMLLTRNVKDLMKITEYYEKMYNQNGRFARFMDEMNNAINTIIAMAVRDINIKADGAINATLRSTQTQIVKVAEKIENLDNDFDDILRKRNNIRSTVAQWRDLLRTQLSQAVIKTGKITGGIRNQSTQHSKQIHSKAIQKMVGSVIDTIEKSLSIYAKDEAKFVTALEDRRARYAG